MQEPRQEYSLGFDIPLSDEESEYDQMAVPKYVQPKYFLKSFEELGFSIPQRISEGYLPISVLYQSRNTVVVRARKIMHKAQKRQNNQEVDLNNQENLVVIKFSENCSKEANILAIIHQKRQSKSIIKAIQSGEDFLVMQNCDMSLTQLILAGKLIGNQLSLKIFEGLISALEAMEAVGIVHTDLKSSNILYRSKNGYIDNFLVADFGNSLHVEELNQKGYHVDDKVQFGQSFQYCAPETMTTDKDIKIDSKIDIWGLGCIIFEFVTGQHLLPEKAVTVKKYLQYSEQCATEKQIDLRIRRFSSPSLYNLFYDLIRNLLHKNSEQRINVAGLRQFYKIKSHPQQQREDFDE